MLELDASGHLSTAVGAVPAELLSMRVWEVLGKLQIENSRNNAKQSSKGHYLKKAWLFSTPGQRLRPETRGDGCLAR